MDYQIAPVTVTGISVSIDGVYENEEGDWAGEVERYLTDDGNIITHVAPFCDEDGDFIPAPENWRELIVKPL